MSIQKTLAEHARDLAAHAKQIKAQLEQERLNLEHALAENNLAMQRSGSADENLAKFLHALRTDAICPDCWFSGRGEIALTTAPGAGGIDRFRCPGCRNEFDAV